MCARLSKRLLHDLSVMTVIPSPSPSPTSQELQKELDDYEPKIDEVVGCGQLLCRQCVPEDAEVIQKKLEELQAQWDLAKAEASQRQSDLEEALLALGQFQDAYDELMRWLEEAEDQLNHPEPITGNPDQVATLQGKHKVCESVCVCVCVCGCGCGCVCVCVCVCVCGCGCVHACMRACSIVFVYYCPLPPPPLP